MKCASFIGLLFCFACVWYGSLFVQWCFMGFAEVLEPAFVALGPKGGAGVSAVEDEPVVCVGDFFFGEVFGECLFYGVWCGAGFWYESQSVAYAKDVGVDCHPCFAPDDAQYDVGCFASDAGQCGQLLRVLRYFSAVFFPQHSCHFYEVFGFVVGVGDGTDVFVDDFRCGQSHCLGIGIVFEEFWGDEVDALVGALCAEDDGYEQLEWIAVVQFCFCFRHCLAEVCCYFAI